MNSRLAVLILVIIALTAITTSVLYKPVSVYLFEIFEPKFTCPIKTSDNRVRVRCDSYGSGEFGAKRSNGRTHDGIDLLAPIGTKIYAAKSGLAFAGNVPTGYGKYVMIYHPDGSQTIYGHLSNFAIPAVKNVKRGELIGYSGNTGNAKSNLIQPHIHFEIRKRGSVLDPRSNIQ